MLICKVIFWLLYFASGYCAESSSQNSQRLVSSDDSNKKRRQCYPRQGSIKQPNPLLEHEVKSSTHDDNPLWKPTDTDILKKNLLKGYDKYVRPSHQKNATSVSFGVEFTQVYIDDKKFLMSAHGWPHMNWNDDKLKWNASDYGGLDVLHISEHEIWQPDIFLYNSALGKDMDHFAEVPLLLYSTGSVLWVPPAFFVVFCELDLSSWPFDVHTCFFKFGSWTRSGEQINLTASTAKMEGSLKNVEWQVLRMSIGWQETVYECCPEAYPSITVNVTVKRHSSSYYTILVAPSIGLVTMTLSTFWLNPYALEKFIIYAITALILSAYLIFFAQRLPIIGQNTPCIVSFFSNHLVMVAFSVAISVVTYNLCKMKRPVPWYLSNLLKGPLGTILGLHQYHIGYVQEMGGDEMKAYDNSREEGAISNTQDEQKGKQWIIVAMSVDRLVFAIYTFVFLCLALRCMI